MAPLEVPATAGDFDALVMLAEVLRLARGHLNLAGECVTAVHDLLSKEDGRTELADDLTVVGHQLDRSLDTLKECRRQLLAGGSEE